MKPGIGEAKRMVLSSLTIADPRVRDSLFNLKFPILDLAKFMTDDVQRLGASWRRVHLTGAISRYRSIA